MIDKFHQATTKRRLADQNPALVKSASKSARSSLRLEFNTAIKLFILVNLISTITCVPQQIFIPGLNIGGSSNINHHSSNSQKDQSATLVSQKEKKHDQSSALPFRLSENQINDLFQLFNANQQHQKQQLQQHLLKQQQKFQQNANSNFYNNHVAKNEQTIQLSTSAAQAQSASPSASPVMASASALSAGDNLKRIIPKPELLEHLNNDIERYFHDAATETSGSPSYPSSASSAAYSSQSSAEPVPSTTIRTTTPKQAEPATTTYYPHTYTLGKKEQSIKIKTNENSLNSENMLNEDESDESGKNIERDRPSMANLIDVSNNNQNANSNSNDNNLANDYVVPNPSMNMLNAKKLTNNLGDANIINPRLSFGNNFNIPMGQQQYIQQPQQIQQMPQISMSIQHQPQISIQQPQQLHHIQHQYRPIDLIATDCSNNRNSNTADEIYCNLFHMCSNGVYQPLLCPEGFLYSEATQKCEMKNKVDCGKRIPMDFDHRHVPVNNDYMNEYYNSAPSPKVINGSLECLLGTDGYFADPEFCNIYHHCLAGVDYAEQCPHQLVWNDRKKMCDWQTSVNCTGRIIPVAQGQTSFCTDKADNKYADAIYCNVFHHCVGGIDNVVRCDEELQWNDKDKKCDWESKVRCMGKMLPSEKHYNSTFCIGKPDGPYAHEEYCNVYHVCESGTDNIRQCPNQLFWDYRTKRCDWSGNVECTGRTLITLSTDTTLFCMERRDGVYGDPNWCNVYHNCLSGVDFKTKCPVGLIWNETKKDCDWSDTTQCATGNFLRDATDMDKKTFCIDKPNGKYAHEMHCNRYYVCQNGKDIIFTCQNNLRYNATKQECDWAVNVQCYGKSDYMWEGIKENFCKNKPDGNYPDPVYCNIFHQCQAATDYPKRCSNRLMFHEGKGECDWEDQVDCRGKEKLIETSGLQDESKPENNGDGKGRVTKFCMTKENGNYADLYYCNVYHNCHGGFDTVQYCANGLVWRQDSNVAGTCDWPMSSKIANGVDCGMKKIFLIDKQSQVDIMATLRSDFCITRGEGLFAHTKYCDLYIHCTAQAVAITMECAPGLIFNEKKRECDYLSEDQMNLANSSYCPMPKQILRPKPKADGTLMFNGNDVTGKFPTKFACDQKNQQYMYNDDDWCNIYHVCAGPRDNIFICPPGTVFNKQKQGCFDRYTTQICSGSVNYYKPNNKRPPTNNFIHNANNNNYELYY